MKSKILTTVQDIHEDINGYLEYNAKLARDFNLNVELVANSPRITMSAAPTAVMGQGLAEPQHLVERKTLDFNENVLNKHANHLKLFHPNVETNIKIGQIEGRIYEDSIKEHALLWTINQKSNDNLYNQIFGTTETEISKNTYLPALTIPENHKYKKPETLLLVIRDTPSLDMKYLNRIINFMELRAVYVYHEDEKDIRIEDIMNSLGKEFKQFSGTIKTFSLTNDSDLLLNIVDREKPEWIGFANFERSVFERLYKINTNHLILSSKLPVLNF